MDEKGQFFSIIRFVKKKLQWAEFMKEMQLFVLEISCVFFLWMVISRIVVIPFLYQWIGVTVVFLFLYQLFRLWKGRIQTEEAVAFINPLVGEDRVLSAYRFIKKNGPIETLLVRDTVWHLEKERGRISAIKFKKLYPVYILFSALFLSFGILSSLYPSDIMIEAKKQEKERKIVEKIKEDLRDDWLEETDSSLKKLKKELLQKVEDAKGADELLEHITGKTKETELSALKESEKTENYEQWLDALKANDLSSFANTIQSSDMDGVRKELAKLEKQFENLSENSKNALLSQIPPDDGNWIKTLEEQIKEWKEGEERLRAIQRMEQYLAETRQNISNEFASNDLLPPNYAFDDSPADSSHEGETSNSETNSETGETRSSNIGEGEEHSTDGTRMEGNVPSTHSDDGLTPDPSSNQGGGKGNDGRSESEDQLLLTVPERIDGPIHLEEDFGILGEGRRGEVWERECLAIKGHLRPYEEVYSEYEKAYLQSMNRLNLPEDLRKMIRNYFSNIKP
ncbi:hypothetical protein [Fervidibacillus albus]|uniref:Uncharacterized protein n=1 Tax=Fervidibacillus albus TaxID=2980026 RepID=A0A9E8RWH1_9BACI|nr:hypothetical protein [Fervidibacillus albus]WAA10681.1 hypothetical protein OE104_05030 [Fervidibacillus albus]